MRRLIAELGSSEPVRLTALLAAGKKVSPDVTSLLADDHRTVLGWFRWCEHTSDVGVRKHLIPRIIAALRAHMAAEEEHLYPGVSRRDVAAPLAERAFAEHAAAKKIMDQLEKSPDEAAAADGLVAKLQREIAAHVAEEEAELFPAARRAELDLFAIGRDVAAARVRKLLAQKARSAPPAQHMEQEERLMQISQADARDYFVTGLKNAHATVRHGRLLSAQQAERLENYPHAKAKLEAHLLEKDAQLLRLEQLLGSYGESPSAVKDAAMSMAAGVAGLASSASADEVVKNSFAALAQAKYEAAAFETLLVFAEAAGESVALRPLQLCLNESRGLATFIEENLRPTAIRFLALRSAGKRAKS